MNMLLSARVSGVCTSQSSVRARSHGVSTLVSPVANSKRHSGIKVAAPVLKAGAISSPLFEQRCAMAARHSRCVRVAARSSSSEPWWTKDNPPNMYEVNNVQEFVDFLAEAQDKLVIVEFYATWCNACKSLFPKLCKILAENPNVVCLKVDLNENKQLCKGLGIKVLPFFHFYKGAEGRVEAFSCSLSKLQRFRDALELHNGDFCNLEPFNGLPEFPEVEPHLGAAPVLASESLASSKGISNGTSSDEATSSVYETLLSVEGVLDAMPAPAAAATEAQAVESINGMASSGHTEVVTQQAATSTNRANGNVAPVVPDAVPLEVLAGWAVAEAQGASGNGVSRHSGQGGQLAAVV